MSKGGRQNRVLCETYCSGPMDPLPISIRLRLSKVATLDITTLHTFPRISPKSDGLKPIDLTNEWIEKQWRADVMRLHAQGIRVWASASSTGFYPDMFREHGLDAEQFYARDAKGGPQMMLGGSYGKDVMSGCYNNPKWMALLEANTLAYVNAGFDGIWFDVGGYADAAVLYCHCEFCTADWKARVKEVGLPEDTPLPTAETGNDFTQAANRAHLRWRYEVWENAFRKIRYAAKAVNPHLLYLHNSSAMPDGIVSVGVYFTAITELYDAAHWEEWGHGAAPYSLLPSYFLGRMAAGPRPVLLVQNDVPARTAVQHRIALAEAYAAGGVLQNQNVPDANRHLYRFLKRHEDIYVGRESMATVAIMTSIRSKDYYENPARVKPAYWMGWLLQDLHIPYDYLLAERDFNAEALQKYEVVFLPDLAVMEDKQVSTLREYIAHGGRVLATHNTAKYNEEMKDLGRARLAALAGRRVEGNLRVELDAGRFAYIEDYPEKQYTDSNTRDLAVSKSLSPPGAPPGGFKAELDWIAENCLPIEVQARSTTAIVPQRQEGRILIQAINYNTYPDGEQLTPDEDVRVTLQLPEGQTVRSAKGFSPDVEGFAVDVSLEQTNGAAIVELKKLDTYTVIALEMQRN